MELREVIKTRRSIRRFKDKEVSKDILEEVIKTAMWAPSAMNTQPWKFYVISGTKKNELIEIMSKAFDGLKPRLESLFKEKMVNMIKSYFLNFGNAPHIVVVTTDKLENETYQIGAYESASAAIQNFSLIAHEADLGTCWMTGVLFVEKEILKFIEAEDKKVAAVLTVGYPDQEPPVPPRKDEEIIWMR
jgi:nitroreductase